MQCRICNNEAGNELLELKEMMYGLKEVFNYFECGKCGCVQIIKPPEDMSKYYPNDYYSYTSASAGKKANFFKRLQCQSIIGANKSLLAKIITYKYRPPEYYETLKFLKLYKLSSPVLDVGSGGGDLLKFFYESGYKDLTGIDPYINSDIVYNDRLRIQKKGLFEIDRTYDAIMLNHSLEHMDNQMEVLKKLYSILSDNGRLLIRIPVVSKPLLEEYGSNVVSLDAPRHFFIHSFNSISLLVKNAGFVIENFFYDSHEFSFWGSEQYKNNISLHNNPESYLYKKTFSDEQMEKWRTRIAAMNKKGESDNIAIYLKK